MKRTVFVTAVVCVLSLACMAANARKDIEAAGKAFADAINRGDSAAVAAMYADDAKLYPPNSEMVTGRENVRQLWQGFVQAGAKNMTFQVDEVLEAGKYLVEMGRYSVDVGNQKDTGKYIVVWKKDGGKWKLFRDIWNSSQPAPAAK